jgi:protein Tex
MATLDNNAIAYTATKTAIPLNKVISTCNLLFTESCTIPFISRYRKEVTGNLDEVQIRDIQLGYEEYIEIEKRRTYILDTIKKMEMLTPDLEKKIKAAATLNQLEDLYAPYKTKKKTKAMLAKEKGLEPLANMLLTMTEAWDKKSAELEKQFINDKVKTLAEAIEGACDILMENIAHDIELKEKFRKEYWSAGKITASKRKDAEKIEEYLKFKDFFEFSEPIGQIKDKKASHRYLALRRGMNLKILSVSTEIDNEMAYKTIENTYFKDGSKLGNYELLQKVAKKSFDNMIGPSLDLEVKGDLKKFADESAIEVFGINLKNLLLQPYLGSKAVLGIDPGIRTGCKVVIIDHTGKFIGDHVIYPFEPRCDVMGAKMIIDKMIEMFKIEYIAIGNGTNGRETLEFVETHIDAVKNGIVKATIISESGASIYSASDIARAEFPDKDVTVRGAISIARRFQDPLAELVKIDPKSIGVGQYQHDINQVMLKKSLEGVVESCVNFVGVDLNTASAPLLSYVSGIGPAVAKNIVTYREKKGGLKSRTELLDVPRFSQKIFEQCAGFLRIYNGVNPLDSTFIHPERYSILEDWCKKNNKQLIDLVNDKELQLKLSSDTTLKEKIGAMTFADIVKSLGAPVQDPRKQFKSVEFDRTIKNLSDVKPGSWYNGVVTNITNFGAFVDIGIKENGLLHISEISNEFVENALDKLTVGQEVKVKVVAIDSERKRLALSCKTDAQVDYSKSNGAGKTKQAAPPVKEIRNNAFAGLKGLKL